MHMDGHGTHAVSAFMFSMVVYIPTIVYCLLLYIPPIVYCLLLYIPTIVYCLLHIASSKYHKNGTWVIE